MTALKPLENLRVRGVASERYPLNEKCAHPECNEAAVDPHHSFPRSQIGNDSWFVEITEDRSVAERDVRIVPHVTGLCRAHHDAVESHGAWIRLEGGEFVWYDRYTVGGTVLEDGTVHEFAESGVGDTEWRPLGPLNPQPGSREGKPKRKKKTGEARRTRRTISIKVPADTENGGEVWDETLEQVKAKLVTLGLYDEGADIPIYEALIAALRDWLDTVLFDGGAA